MILYAVTAVLCIFLWKMSGWFLSYVHTRRAISKSLSHFPLPEEHHWFFGIAHLVRHADVMCSYTMGCPPVRGDNPRALASGLSYVQVDNPWYNYFMPPTSV